MENCYTKEFVSRGCLGSFGDARFAISELIKSYSSSLCSYFVYLRLLYKQMQLQYIFHRVLVENVAFMHCALLYYFFGGYRYKQSNISFIINKAYKRLIIIMYLYITGSSSK